MVMIRTTLTALALSACTTATVEVARQIDRGGHLHVYVDRVADIRASGRTFRAPNVCLSACTQYLALRTTGQLCVARSDVWGFHGSHYKRAQFTESAAQDIRAYADDLKTARAFPPAIRDRFMAEWRNLGPTEYHSVSGADLIDNYGVKQC